MMYVVGWTYQTGGGWMAEVGTGHMYDLDRQCGVGGAWRRA